MRRYLYLDSLRGIAVFLMILAHAVYFFTDRSSRILTSFESFANTVAFSTFLLIASTVTYLAYFSSDESAKDKRHNFLSRLLILLVSYYLLATLASLATIVSLSGMAKIKFILSIITFRELPSYTEFFPPFIIFGFLALLFPKFFRLVTKNWAVLAVTALGSFWLGELISSVKLSYIFEPFQRLVAGGEGVYRFSLLHYFGIYLVGLYFSRNLAAQSSLEEEKELVKNYFSFFAILLFISFVLNEFFRYTHPFFIRWPPNIPFLLVGMVFAFGMMLVVQGRLFTTKGIVRESSLIFGQNAFALLWTHLAILQIYLIAGGEKIDSPLLFAFLTAALIIGSLALTTFIPFNFKFSLTRIRPSQDADSRAQLVYQFQKDLKDEISENLDILQEKLFLGKKSTSRRKFVLGSLVLVLALWTGTLFYPIVVRQVKVVVSPALPDDRQVWWDESWTYRRALSLGNPRNFDNLESGKLVSITLDHLALVSQKQSDPHANDLRVVFQDFGRMIELNSQVEKPLNNATKIYFPLQETLGAGKKDDRYYLYFGNPVIQSIAKRFNLDKSLAAQVSQELGTLETYPIVSTLDRLWYLLEANQTDKQVGHISVGAWADIKEVQKYVGYFRVLNQPISGTLVLNEEEKIWEASFNYQKLPPGSYQVQSFFELAGRKLVSQKAGFFVSKPLYYSWTLDWEGYDVSDRNLNALFDLAQRYQIPLTHYYNPRIYLAGEIPSERVELIEKTVKERLSKGDELALHLHMHKDLVESAGVIFRSSPRWGFHKGDGYDVPSLAYEEDELVAIIAYSLSLMKEKGFPHPVCYRAGGWFADIKLLRALEKNQIMCDSSGRTAYSLSRSGVPGHWNLPEGAQPYRPSTFSINQTSLSPMNLVEIPNNLLDTYNNDAKSLTELFKRIYPGGTIDTLRQITLTSHPQWFDEKKEKKTATKLIELALESSYLYDRGPLVFVTVGEILQAFNRE